MKNLWPIIGLVALVLLAIIVAGRFRESSRQPDAVSERDPAMKRAEAIASPGAVQGAAAQAVAGTGGQSQQPATAPVVGAVVNEHHHDDAGEKPSQETIDAIREIRKPVEGEGQVIQHADGAYEMKLGNRYQSVPVATVGKDGKVHVDYHGEKYVPVETKSDELNTEKKNP